MYYLNIIARLVADKKILYIQSNLSQGVTQGKDKKWLLKTVEPGRVAQSVEHLTRKSGVLGSVLGLATYFRFSFRFFKKGSCQLLAKVCERTTG